MGLVVNLWGSPGSGKSTMAWGLAYYLKRGGYKVELSAEYAKELALEGLFERMKDQVMIFAEQRRRLNLLASTCDIVINDCPLLMGAAYYDELYPDVFRDTLKWAHEENPTLDFFVRRAHAYVGHGRVQTEAESDALAYEMRQLMDAYGVRYDIVKGTDDGLEEVLRAVRYEHEMRSAPAD